MKEVPVEKLKGKSKTAGTIFVLTISVIVILFLITINLLGYTWENPHSSSVTLIKEDLEYTLKAEKEKYKLDEPVKIDLTIINHSNEKAELYFDGEEKSEFIVEKAHNLLLLQPKLIIWKSSFGNEMNKKKTDPVEISSKGEKVFSTTWKQVDGTEKKVTSGSYLITCLVKNDEQPLHPYTQALLSSIPVPDPDKKAEDKRIILEGDVPSPQHPPPGCKFNTRCWLSEDLCREKEPDLFHTGNDHYVSCHIVERKFK